MPVGTINYGAVLLTATVPLLVQEVPASGIVAIAETHFWLSCFVAWAGARVMMMM
jgi:hypothetical protein